MKLALALACALTTAALAQDSVDDHLAAAKLAAGFEFTGTLSRNCIDPAHDQVAPGPRGVIPDRAQWHAEPARVYDNLYFIGIPAVSIQNGKLVVGDAQSSKFPSLPFSSLQRIQPTHSSPQLHIGPTRPSHHETRRNATKAQT